MQFTTLVALAVSFAVAAQAATVATPSESAAAAPNGGKPNGGGHHHHPHQRVNVHFFQNAQCRGQSKTVELNRNNVNQCNNAGMSFLSVLVDVPKGSDFDVNDIQVGRNNCAQSTLRRITKANACVDLGGKIPNTQFTVNHKRGGNGHAEADGEDDE